jgi:hypothetical protein
MWDVLTIDDIITRFSLTTKHVVRKASPYLWKGGSGCGVLRPIDAFNIKGDIIVLIKKYLFFLKIEFLNL